MATHTSPDDMLAQRLALDVCEQWKLETGRKALSVDDLNEVKAWVNNARATVSSFPSLQMLAIKGINTMIAQQGGRGLVVADC